MSSQFSVISIQFRFLRQLRTNDLCIRGDLLQTINISVNSCKLVVKGGIFSQTIANNEFVFSHQLRF